MSPNEHLNNIILERIILLVQPENSTAKESSATSEIEITWIERPKSTRPVRHMSYHMSRYQLTGRDMPLQKLSRVAILVSLQECGLSRTYTWPKFGH